MLKKWVAPPVGIMKINAAASLKVDGWVGIGVVAREDTEAMLFAATRRTKAFLKSGNSKAKAVEMTVRLGKRCGYKDVILESDCQIVINCLSNSATYLSDLDTILHDVPSSCTSFSSICWSHIKRDGYFVVHHLVS